MKEVLDLGKLKDKLIKFAKEREWEQFHSPKNLAMALSVESSELVEIFQWLTEEQSKRLPEDKMKDVRDEIADIFVYIVRMCTILDIDINDAVESKMKHNAEKYPVDKARGSAKKYNEY
jgi:dCTP diphosphatase